jgi:hypothetical protein
MLLRSCVLLEVSWLDRRLHVVRRILEPNRLLSFHILCGHLIFDRSGKDWIAKCLRDVVGALLSSLHCFRLILLLNVKHFLGLKQFSELGLVNHHIWLVIKDWVLLWQVWATTWILCRWAGCVALISVVKEFKVSLWFKRWWEEIFGLVLHVRNG